MPKTIVQEFTKGLWEELPPFRLVLGLCPVLGVTTTMENGLGMGIATTFVLFGSNLLVSLLKNIIPQKVRIACFIIIIASFVTIVELLMQAYAYPLYLKLGVFIPLIVVNCIVLGRAEAFAYKNNLSHSMADGLGIGIGCTLSLGALGAIRELLGNGSVTIWGDMSYHLAAVFPSFQPFAFMVKAPGAFVCLGLMLCVINAVGEK
jgi:electron transport complex protein RnfE